jgi:26S proteasome regulatory subunit N1
MQPIALIAMGEDIDAEMSLRQFNHLQVQVVSEYHSFFYYCASVNLVVCLIKDALRRITIRKTVPLAIGLVSASNPHLPILDTLSIYSWRHDNDLQVAIMQYLPWGFKACWRRHEQCSLDPDAETTCELLVLLSTNGT